MTEHDLLLRRVLNAVPAHSYAMNGLLSLLRIEASREVETAAVSCERRPVLRINPDFVRQRCRTDEHLFMLVMHELYHVLLGHTRLFPRATPAHNVAFVAVINSLLVLQHPERTYSSFFLDLYGPESGAARLLAPPEGKEIVEPALAALHRLLYDGHGKTSSEEIYGQLVRSLEPSGRGGLLLGSHGRRDPAAVAPDTDSWGTEGPVDPVVVDAIRRIVERWPKPQGARRGRSLSEILEHDRVGRQPTGRDVLAVLRRALTSASVARFASPRRGAGRVVAQVPLPDLRDRRGVVLRSAGHPPLFYESRIDAPRAARAGQARVYLDVSGSMEAYLPALYAALSTLRQLVQPQVVLFSTRTVTVALADFVSGAKAGTGGTSIDCVVEDLLVSRTRKALVLTDGYVGGVGAADRKRLAASGVDVRVVLTPGGWRKDLQPVASRFDELPQL